VRAARHGRHRRSAADKEAAKKLISVGETKPDEKLAAWAMLANTVLNLDEVLNKG
jgi:hypothetical protein